MTLDSIEQDPWSAVDHEIPADARRAFWQQLRSPPNIAAVNGDALGLGATLALMCDISVIAETVRFGDTHVRVGLVAGDGGAVIWPLLIGVNKAKNFLMRARIAASSPAPKRFST